MLTTMIPSSYLVAIGKIEHCPCNRSLGEKEVNDACLLNQ